MCFSMAASGIAILSSRSTNLKARNWRKIILRGGANLTVRLRGGLMVDLPISSLENKERNLKQSPEPGT